MAPLAQRSLQGLRNGRAHIPQCRATRYHPHISSPSQTRWHSTAEALSNKSRPEKPFYVTTPIFYVNAAPHIGHLYTMVLSDVLKRWQVLQGRPAFLSTGTDEHGMKIQQAARKQEVEPQELCDTNSDKFRKLAETGGLSEDVFVRTTQPSHKEAVEHFWSQLRHGVPKSMGLYKSKHSGWYSVDDECFYPEKLITTTVHPQTGQKYMASTETSSAVEWVDEETWVFPLTKYKERLLKFYDDNPDWIQPAHRMNEVRAWVNDSLEDLSVTRPFKRLQWGIPDPDDRSQTIYVWVDALVNYLTVAGYGKNWHSGHDFEKAIIDTQWPADVQVVGKDIIRFHAVYWPALLMALELPLPKKILCHNHWTMSNRKMSKSVGNVVNPTFAVQRWGKDPLRYFLMRNGSLERDMNYSNDTINAIYTKELMANIGNLFYRVFRSSGKSAWTVMKAADLYANGYFVRAESLNDARNPETHYSRMEGPIDDTPEKFKACMDDNDISGALGVVYDLLSETNRYITDTAPWKMLPKELPEEPSGKIRKLLIARDWVIFNCAEALRISAILLQPILPEKATRLLTEMGVQEHRRTYEWAAYGADYEYGTQRAVDRVPKAIDPWDTIFPPVPAGELSDMDVKKAFGEVFSSKSGKALPAKKVAQYIAMERRLEAEEKDALVQEAEAAQEAEKGKKGKKEKL